ncbi:unnamed protein product [Symbiodinium sp. CCMP2592]|nr:unnamed protein product [Symbiodinium sp. CCMP2592]
MDSEWATNSRGEVVRVSPRSTTHGPFGPPPPLPVNLPDELQGIWREPVESSSSHSGQNQETSPAEENRSLPHGDDHANDGHMEDDQITTSTSTTPPDWMASSSTSLLWLTSSSTTAHNVGGLALPAGGDHTDDKEREDATTTTSTTTTISYWMASSSSSSQLLTSSTTMTANGERIVVGSEQWNTGSALAVLLSSTTSTTSSSSLGVTWPSDVVRDTVNVNLIHGGQVDVVELVRRLLVHLRRGRHRQALLEDAIEEALGWIQLPIVAAPLNVGHFEQAIWTTILQQAEFGSGPTTSSTNATVSAPSALLGPGFPDTVDALLAMFPGTAPNTIVGYRRRAWRAHSRRLYEEQVLPVPQGHWPSDEDEGLFIVQQNESIGIPNWPTDVLVLVAYMFVGESSVAGSVVLGVKPDGEEVVNSGRRNIVKLVLPQDMSAISGASTQHTIRVSQLSLPVLGFFGTPFGGQVSLPDDTRVHYTESSGVFLWKDWACKHKRQ